MLKLLRPHVTALLLSLFGIAVFLALGFPLPWLLGAIFPLLIASRFDRVELASPDRLVHPARALLGIAIGSSFTAEILSSLDRYLISLALMLPFLLVVILLGRFYYHRIIKLDASTSVFCALPGGLLETAIICEAHGANLRRVVLTHTTRVLLVIYGIPFLLQMFNDIDLSGAIRMPAAAGNFSIFEIVLLIGSAAAGWWLVKISGLGGASIVGPMLASALLHIGGFTSFRPPGELINLAQLVLGIRIGLAFRDITAREIGHSFAHAAGMFALLLAVTLVAAYGVHLLTGIALIATLLAYMPGGQAEMNVIAIIIGIHVPYIALHHMTRIFLVMTLAPTLARVLGEPPATARQS
jgi:hypothetical protein